MNRQTIIKICSIIPILYILATCSKGTTTESPSENRNLICYINQPSAGSSYTLGSAIEILVIANDEDVNYKSKFLKSK